MDGERDCTAVSLGGEIIDGRVDDGKVGDRDGIDDCYCCCDFGTGVGCSAALVDGVDACLCSGSVGL